MRLLAPARPGVRGLARVRPLMAPWRLACRIEGRHNPRTDALGTYCLLCCRDLVTASRADRRPDAPLSAPTAPSAELANGSTCGFCGKPADVWPSKDCEEPQEHTTAVYDCDCGDVVTIADAIASPKQHRRCHLIGTGE